MRMIMAYLLREKIKTTMVLVRLRMVLKWQMEDKLPLSMIIRTLRSHF